MIDMTMFSERRAQLRARLGGGGLVLLPGNLDSPMNYADNTYPFRQDSSFRYFFGIDQPGMVGIIDLDSGVDALFGEDPSLHDIVWTGPLPTLAERAAQAGVSAVGSLHSLTERVAGALALHRNVHFLPPYRAETVLQIAALLGCSAAAVKTGCSTPLVDAVVAMRLHKCSAEVAEMEAALAVAAEMHVEAMRQTRPGVFEHVVVGRMEGIVRCHDWQLAYPVIFSHRGEVLHNHDHSHRMQAGDWIVNDSGAASGSGYASDITRTLPVSGRFTPLQQDLYNIVLEAQQAVIGSLAPEVAFIDMHKRAARILVEGLKGFGLFRGDTDSIVECGAYAAIFQCGLGHHIGMDVHDMENLGEDRVGYGDGFVRSEKFGLRSLRLARRLREGNVVTVEPGIYLIPALFEQWQAERKFTDHIDYGAWQKLLGCGGVRIEDDVLITASGARVLGPHIPRTVAEVEAAMGSG